MNLLPQYRPTVQTESKRLSRLIVVANRLPVTPAPRGRWKAADGGLVQALSGATAATATTWIGWNPHIRTAGHPPSDDNRVLHSIRLDGATADDYYDGYSNRTLWPMLHHLVHPAALDSSWWPSYRRVNQIFADQTRRVCLAHLGEREQGPAVWIHDYHLMLVPSLLRRSNLDAPVAFSFHTPFPPPAILAGLAERSQLLEGVLGADLITFQTEADLENFRRSCHRDLKVTCGDNQVTTCDGRTVDLAVHPASIDVPAVIRDAQSDDVRSLRSLLQARYDDRRVIFGVDRLDYTKGIPERLRAVETLAYRRPDLAAQVVFVQVGVPTRQNVPEYRRLRSAVEEEARRINRALAPALGRDLIEYRCGHLDRNELIARYATADVMLVTPLRDGMNLVAKEFLAVQAATDGYGALVLSRHAGAASQLGHEAILCDPFDPWDLAVALEHACDLPVAERRQKIAVMGDHLSGHDSRAWASQLLAALWRSFTRPL